MKKNLHHVLSEIAWRNKFRKREKIGIFFAAFVNYEDSNEVNKIWSSLHCCRKNADDNSVGGKDS